MRCPKCNSRMAFDRRVFRRGFLCRQCGSELAVSETYSRVLVAISIVLGFGLPWFPLIQGYSSAFLRSCVGLVALLGLEVLLALATLFLLVRVAPFLVSPPLVLRRETPISVLGLGSSPPRGDCESHSER
jgi:hypothetical protein